jgi:Ras-related C3 botulinum toxin substrate 1
MQQPAGTTSTDQLVKKVVVVGDGAVGKTCLLAAYSGKPFDPAYVPTIFENYTTEVTFGDKVIRLSLWDTAGQEEYDRIRIMSYVNVQCFIVAFSVVDSITYRNVKERWIPELQHYSPETPVLLVGTKEDLRGTVGTSDGRSEVTYEQGKELKEQIGAVAYLECSAVTRSGVKAVFDTAVRVVEGAMRNPREKKKDSKKCILL